MSSRREVPLLLEDIDPRACTIERRYQVLQHVPFFAELSPIEIEDVNRLFHEHGYLAGETIYFAGFPATKLYVVAAGKVRLVGSGSSGQDILLDILVPGEFFGSLATLGDAVYSETSGAQTDCCVLWIPARAFQAVLRRYPAVTLAVLDIVSRRLREAREMVRQLTSVPAESRIAATLLKLAEKLGERQEHKVLIQLPLSRQDLAAMTGTTAETASRVISQFRKAGLVESGRQWIAITDTKGLEATARGEPQ